MITKKPKKHTNWVKTVLLIVVLFALSFFIVYKIEKMEDSLRNKIFPNIFLDNLLIEGKTKTDLEKWQKEKDQILSQLELTIIYHNKPIATFSAKQTNLHSNIAEIGDRAMIIGRTPLFFPRFYQLITSFFRTEKYKFFSSIIYNKDPFKDFIAISEEAYNKPAKNALFQFKNDRVTSFRQEEKGLKILTDLFYQDLDQQIQNLKINPKKLSIILNDQIVNPEIILSEANQFGIKELIAEGESNFSYSITNRVHNITVAASRFNGVLIPKGKEFSFNENIGDISALTGYQQAYIIKEGKTVLGDGGGVCQVSTTFFRAALNAGLPITERQAHAYRVNYYENDSKPGLDATTFAPSVDLKFINDTPAYILIQTDVNTENNILIIKLYGKKDERKITLSPIIIYDLTPPLPSVYQEDPTLKKGVTKQVDFAAGGAKSKFDYKVTLADKTIFEKTFFSIYRPWAAVYLVGTKE